jgi:poly-gamma-glutamate synthesis protein (capsule biosynthesis protein)
MLAPYDATAQCGSRCIEDAFPSLYDDAGVFSTAIDRARSLPPSASPISGITVPHHLVAADLIAYAFRLIEGQHYDKVVILSPDHFNRSERPFATTRRDFNTVFGRLATRRADAERLLAVRDLVDESDLFEHEHGIGALLPFLKHALPDTQIVPIAVSIHSRRNQWDRFVRSLFEIVGPTTLVVQSTDFSHYLSFGEAIRRDQQSLNIIAAGTLDDVARLSQPQNLDSRGSQYIQMRLQREHLHADARVLFNSNQQAYSRLPLAQTTSYVVEAYSPRAAVRAAMGDLPGSKVYCFAGDTFFGRRIASALSYPEVAARVSEEMRAVLNGCRLILNLEGVVVARLPSGLPPLRLAMPKPLVLEWLHALNVEAVGVANNHAMDLGEDAFCAMVGDLQGAGIKVLRHGDAADLGSFRLLALTDLDNSRKLPGGVITDEDLDRVARSSARPPLFTFLHWGNEHDPAPTQRARAIADGLRRSAVSLIVGAHPHVASASLEMNGGGRQLMAFSLGNFLFDESSQRASGSVLEVRIFDQGTFFARLIPVPNFIEDARQADPR